MKGKTCADVQVIVAIIHVEVFENFISICNTGRNEYALKLKGTKKCNLQFAVFGAKASSFSIIRAI